MWKCVFGHVRTAMAQISLHSCTVWSGPWLCANRITWYYRLHVYQWRAKTWMILHAWAVWSKSAHFEDVWRQVIQCICDKKKSTHRVSHLLSSTQRLCKYSWSRPISSHFQIFFTNGNAITYIGQVVAVLAKFLNLLNFFFYVFAGFVIDRCFNPCHAEDATPISNFQPIRLLDLGCWYKFTY